MAEDDFFIVLAWSSDKPEHPDLKGLYYTRYAVNQMLNHMGGIVRAAVLRVDSTHSGRIPLSAVVEYRWELSAEERHGSTIDGIITEQGAKPNYAKRFNEYTGPKQYVLE